VFATAATMRWNASLSNRYENLTLSAAFAAAATMRWKASLSNCYENLHTGFAQRSALAQDSPSHSSGGTSRKSTCNSAAGPFAPSMKATKCHCGIGAAQHGVKNSGERASRKKEGTRTAVSQLSTLTCMTSHWMST